MKYCRFKAGICDLPQGQRNLLLENDLHQSRETRFAAPQGWRAMRGDYRSQVPITRGEVSHALRELTLGQHAIESGLSRWRRGVPEHGNDFQVAVLRRKALSGIAVHILQIRIGFVRQEDTDDLNLPFRGSRHQRREALPGALGIHVSPLFEQKPHGRSERTTGGVHQSRPSVHLSGVDGSSMLQ